MAHPLHTELVDNIKSRDELLVGLFGFLSLIQYLKFLKTKKIFYLLLLILFALLGIFSKLSILVYLALIPVIYLLINKKIKPKQLFLIILVFIFTYVTYRLSKYILLDHHNLIRHYEYYENPLYYLDFLKRIPAGFSVWLYYLFLLLNPFKLSFYYGFDVVPIYDWNNFLPYLGILFFVGLTYLFFKLWRKNSFISFGIAILLINGIAVSNIFMLLPGVVAERFFFLGILGGAIIFSEVVFSMSKKINWIAPEHHKIHFKPAIILVLFILLAPFIYKTFSRNQDWESTETLFKADISHLKNSAKANESMGSVYLSKFRMSQNNSLLIPARKYYLQCIKVYPEYAVAWNNLGFINYVSGNFHEAKQCYLNAIKNNSGNANPPFNLAMLYQHENKSDSAIYFYKKTIVINPDLPNLLPFFKSFIIKQNKVNETIPFLKKQINKTDNYQLQLLLIDLYSYKKDFNLMLKQLNETYKKHPNKQLKEYISEIKQDFSK